MIRMIFFFTVIASRFGVAISRFSHCHTALVAVSPNLYCNFRGCRNKFGMTSSKKIFFLCLCEPLRRGNPVLFFLVCFASLAKTSYCNNHVNHENQVNQGSNNPLFFPLSFFCQNHWLNWFIWLNWFFYKGSTVAILKWKMKSVKPLLSIIRFRGLRLPYIQISKAHAVAWTFYFLSWVFWNCWSSRNKNIKLNVIFSAQMQMCIKSILQNNTFFLTVQVWL